MVDLFQRNDPCGTPPGSCCQDSSLLDSCLSVSVPPHLNHALAVSLISVQINYLGSTLRRLIYMNPKLLKNFLKQIQEAEIIWVGDVK